MSKIFDTEESHLVGAQFIYGGCPNVELSISGSCPVQAFGKIEEDQFYFRARHDNWRLEVYDGDDNKPIIYEQQGSYSGASWMSLDKALELIGKYLWVFWQSKENGGAVRTIKQRFTQAILDKFLQEHAGKQDNEVQSSDN